MQRSTSPKCRKCHKARVSRPGQTCPGCQKPKRHAAASRPFRGTAASVLGRSFPVASQSFFDDRNKGRFFSTHDILQLRNLTELTCTPDEFRFASDLAHALNQWTGRGAKETAEVLTAYASRSPLPLIPPQVSTVPLA